VAAVRARRLDPFSCRNETSDDQICEKGVSTGLGSVRERRRRVTDRAFEGSFCVGEGRL
jgi:hypothetical protein